MLGLMAAALAMAAGHDLKCSARVSFYQPPQDMIATADMAARIAETYLTSIYGEKIIRQELPLKVSHERDVWHITGKDLPPLWTGGVAEIDLCQSNGQVLRIVHGK